MRRKKSTMWSRRRFLRRYMIACVALIGFIGGVNAALGHWWWIALDAFMFTMIVVLYRTQVSRYPLCPQCRHAMFSHYMVVPDDTHTWGWMRCQSSEVEAPERRACFAPFSEGIKEMGVSLHTEAEVNELIAQWIDEHGVPPL